MNHTILIGGARAQKLPSLVCAYSISSWLKESIRIHHGWADSPIEPVRTELRSKTGFSFQRFALPHIADFSGAGLYLDSDMILLDNVMPLFDVALASKSGLICSKNLPAVIGVDCARHKWNPYHFMNQLDDGHWTYKDLMELKVFPEIERTVPDAWNELDAIRDDTKLVHYTDMSRQCWRVRDKRAVSKIWMDVLKCAISDGFIAKSVIEEEVKLGHVGDWIL